MLLKLALGFLGLRLFAGDCISRPCTGATNFPANLYGPLDTRPGTWGHADSASLPIKFKPPPGYRVRILRIRGDLIAWPRKLLARDSAGVAGVLLGFSTTAPEGSIHADWLADNTQLYIQDAVSAEPRRAAFDYGNLAMALEADNTLVLKLAAYLNTTGAAIHMEGTATIRYRFEKSE
jgi:hypothetical protein